MIEEIKNDSEPEIESDTKSDPNLTDSADYPESDVISSPEEVKEVPAVNEVDETDYEKVIASDLEILRSEFPELREIGDITELDNPLRYAALRDLGLSPTEAYMATVKRSRRDNRSHLTSAYGKNVASSSGMMSRKELAEAREIFRDLSDTEIQRLYRRVTSG